MTTLKVDYTTGGDPRDNLSEDELATIRVIELDKLRLEVAQQQVGQKDFDEALHPRDDAGRFTDAGGSSTPSAAPLTPKPGEQISIPHTTGAIHTAYVDDINRYIKVQEAHGGPGLEGENPENIYSQMNVVNATDNGPPDPAQLARCEDAATKFLNDPELQPLFDEYGKPGIVVATGMVTTSDNPSGTFPGENPEDANVVAQWSNGTIFLYAQSAGNPDTPVTPGFSLAGADPNLALIHEYGHQVMGVLGYDKDGTTSDFRTSFVEALSDGVPLSDHMTQTQKEEFQANVDLETNQVSEYASTSPDEAFAEFFTALYQQQKAGAAIEDSYDGGAAEALRIIRDQIAEDTKDNTAQPTLFTRSNP